MKKFFDHIKKQDKLIKLTFLLIVFFFFLYTKVFVLHNRISFGWDQEYFSNVVWDILNNHKFTLLGPRVNNDLGFFLGPYFIYSLVPFYFLGNMSPWSLYFFLITINLSFAILSYFILKKIFTERLAILFILLWSISPMLQQIEFTPWNPSFIPLGVLLTIFILKKINNNPASKSWWLILGLIQGLFLHMHMQFAFVTFFCIIFLIHTLTYKSIPKKNYFLSLLAFFLTFTPLIIFDLRHNFLNSRLFINFFIEGGGNIKDYHAYIPVLLNFLNPLLLFSSTIFLSIIYLLVLVLSLYLTYKRKKFFRSFYLAFTALLILTPLVFSLYGIRPSEYYFLYLIPFLYIFLIDLFKDKKGNIILFFYICLIILYNINKISEKTKYDFRSLAAKEKVVKVLKEKIGNKKYSISFYGEDGLDTGFRYLMKYHKLNVSFDGKNELIEIGIPARETSTKVGIYAITFTKNNKPGIYKE